MALTSKTFRIFVSSTFSDLKEERNALQENVFPELRKLCMQHGFRFQAIDLRWGVSKEASLSQETMRICLEEIKRCQEKSPRPNFIILLGDRYGWQPIPEEIPGEEFIQIKQAIKKNKKDFDVIVEELSRLNAEELLDNWYKEDKNAVPPVYILQPVYPESKYTDSDLWDKEVQQPLLNIFRKAIRDLGLSNKEKLKYEASATHQEIELGAMRVDDADEHVFCLFRNIKNVDELKKKDLSEPPAKDFLDTNVDDRFDETSHEKLTSLKEGLREKLGKDNIFAYEAEWQGNGVTTTHLDKLCKDVYDNLSGIIRKQIDQLDEKKPLEKEIDAHEAFREDRAKHFIGRLEMLGKVKKYIEEKNNHPLAIHGKSGTGKSALMAFSVKKAKENFPDAAVVFRSIGATPASSDGRALLESLCEQIYEVLDYEQQKQQRLAKVEGETEEARRERDRINLEYTIPGDIKKLAETFYNFLVKVPEDKQLIIFLDALDQLSDADNARNLNWLPAELPENIRFIVSTLPDECHEALMRKQLEENLIELHPMPSDEGEKLLGLWLNEAKRALQANQRERILDNFNREGNGKPLYLKLAFEESRRWKSYTEKIKLSSDIRGIIHDLFKRLSSDKNHGKMMVSRSLGYLAAAKNGLTEDELIEILSQDKEVFEDFKQRAFHDPPEPRLPIVIWSRLYFDLEPYLTERSADGAALMTFYHPRSFGTAVRDAYLSVEDKVSRHRGLAEYFERQSRKIGPDDHAVPNLRKLSELPFQQTFGEKWEDLYHTLTHSEFLEQKNTHMGIYELLEDYRSASKAMPTENEVRKLSNVIIAFQRALDQDLFVLKENPELTFPQLYNRLQWQFDENVELKNKLEDEKSRFKRPWLRLITKPAESSAMIRTFIGHTDAVTACIFSLDGQRIFSVSRNTLRQWDAVTGEEISTLKGYLGDVNVFSPDGKRIAYSLDKNIILWDTDSGKEITSLKGHNNGVSACAFSPDGKRIVSASYDKILKVWNIETGEEIAHLSDNNWVANTCAFSPDGKRIVFESGNILKMWNFDAGKEVSSFEGHTEYITACAFSPNGKYILSASKDTTLKIWDGEKGKEIFSLIGHTDKVQNCAFSPDGKRIISASEDQTLKLWDAETGKEIATFAGHTWFVNDCAFSPDGKYIISASDDETLKLWDVEVRNELSTLIGHTSFVNDCAFSPDGTQIISASDDFTVKLWKVETGEEISTFKGHTDDVISCAFSPNGKLIVSGSYDNTLKVWDSETCHEMATLKGHTRSVCACAFSPDGKLIVSGSNDYTLKLWNAETYENISTLTEYNDKKNALAISPDSMRVVYATYDKTLKLYDAKTGEKASTLIGHTGEIRACSFSPDGKYIVSASEDETLKLWDFDTGKEIFTLTGHTGVVHSCAFSPDGKRIVSGGWNILKLWDAETGDVIATLTGHRGIVYSCAFSPDGKRIVSADDADMFNLWNGETGEEIAALRNHTGPVTAFAFSPDSKLIVSASEDETLRLWDAKTGKQISPHVRHTSKINSCAFSPDNKHIVSASEDETLKLWDGETGEEITTLIGHTSGVNLCTFSPDGRRIASGSLYSLKLWNVETGGEIATHTCSTVTILTPELIAFAFSPDGQRIVSSWYDEEDHSRVNMINTFELLDGQTGKLITKLYGHTEQVNMCSFSPDGRQIASGSFEAFKLWDAETGEEIPNLKNYSDSLKSCAFSPDGQLIVSASDDKTIKLWNAETGKQIFSLEGHDGSVITCAFSPDGRLIVSASDDTTLKLWDTETKKQISTLTGHTSLVNACTFSPDGRHIVSMSDDKTLKYWDGRTGKYISTLWGHTDTVVAAFSPDGERIVFGDGIGQVLLACLENVELFAPIVSPIRTKYFSNKTPKAHWDENLRATCRCCGKRFPISNDILEVIEAINRDASQSSGQSSCPHLPDDSWENPRLLSECSFCHKPLKFNPFIVDNRDQ